MIRRDEVLEQLHYDPGTGIFTWLKNPDPDVVGKRAGYVGSHGYWIITLNKRIYLLHRLAWLYVHGDWPTQQIDHVNGDKTDNRIGNLREATAKQNLRNGPMRKTNRVGLKGVYQSARESNVFYAAITVNREKRTLGKFQTAEEAHAAYCRASKIYHGEFGRTE